ncbi:uncharacterized protein LOC127079217 [Lathyrus oleraceus]|uniref:uncharacterized protein LOC127079217 n=1 Tax=Pisum sativum TaxID=3888 RepID=UPI0021CF35EE|nr:uncharacterized protein LOC127079217 [Pisum sativum]
MGPDRKNTLPLKFKLPKTNNMITLNRKITPCMKNNFIGRYGQKLKLLTINVDVGAFVALAQYYDLPLYFFTFRDFQLALTIKKFEILLSWYLKDHAPFTGLGEELTPKKAAEALHLIVREVTPSLGPKGFTRNFLEEKAQELEKEGKWEAFIIFLSLLIYGVVMFLNDDDFINSPPISVFLAKNPVPALLADMYYWLHTRHEKKKGVIICCAPLLYSWC